LVSHSDITEAVDSGGERRRFEMQCNEGKIDRIIRAAVVAPLALVLAAIVGFGTVGGIVLAIVAVIMVATAATGFCPLYRLVGIDTCRVDGPGAATGG
jgi:general stress protein CsbA